jgi:putative protease
VETSSSMATDLSTVELLAPAGSWESLEAALQAGADAVYFGVGNLNMRARAAMNFSDEDLAEIVTRCHAAGTRAYLTLNTVVYDRELPAVEEACRAAAKAGVDAVICHDMAVIQAAREEGLAVHLSTQANVSNFQALRFYSQFAEVVVLARELGLASIREIARQVQSAGTFGPSGKPIRLEAFIHGALCVAISGKCNMSLYQTGHSANRGDCLQTCRRSYTVKDRETGKGLEIENHHVMSPKDLCTVGMLDQLLAAGVTVLKIEGRGRSADYVKTVVGSYRQALEAIREGRYNVALAAQLREELETVFNRGFWDGGYYLGISGDEWAGVSGNRATQKKRQIGIVRNFYEQVSVMELQLQTEGVATGDHLRVMGPTTGCVDFTLDELRVEETVKDAAAKGESLTCKVPEPVRRGDKVFLVKSIVYLQELPASDAP